MKIAFSTLALLALLTVTACTKTSAPRFRDAEELSKGDMGTAPMFAVSSSGKEAAAWVSAPNGGTDGRLNVSVSGGAPVVLRDSRGPIEPLRVSPSNLADSPDRSF